MSEWPHGKNAQEGIDVALENHPKSSDWKVWKQRAKIVAPQRVLRGTPPSCQGWLCAESGKSNVKLQSQIAYWKGKDRTAKSSLVVGSNFNHTRNRIETWWPSQDRHEIQKMPRHKKKNNHFNYRKKFRIEPRVSASFSLFLSGEKASKPPSPSWVTGILAPQGMIQNPSKYERWSMFWFGASYSVFFACFLVERFQFADLIRSHFRAWGHIFHGLVRYRNSKKKSPGILEHAYKSYILKNHQAYKTSLFKVYEHFKLGQVCAQVGQLTRDRLPRLKGCI